MYRALGELGISEKGADRMMIPLMKAPSFEAPRYFAEKASGEMDLLMAALALDMTGLMMIGENYQDSSYAPHAKAAELIMEDEADHEIFASELLGDAVQKFGKKAVQAALQAMAAARGELLRASGQRFHLRLHPLRAQGA